MPWGVGNWLKRNSGTIGTVAGGGIGLLFGQPALGAALGGAVGGAIQGSGAGEEMPDATLPSAGLATGAYRRLSNPTHMLPVFERLARASTPTIDTFTGAQAASGGSAAIAREQMEAATQRGGAQALDAFNQYRTGTDRTALAALGMGLDAERYAVDARLDDYFARMSNRQAIGGQFLTGATGLLGYLYGPGRDQPAGTKPSPKGAGMLNPLGGGRLPYGG